MHGVIESFMDQNSDVSEPNMPITAAVERLQPCNNVLKYMGVLDMHEFELG